MKKSLTSYAHNELETIHGHSRRHNRRLKVNHAAALLKMMEKHVVEIKELHVQKSKHYLIETGDLMVLCLELIKEAKESPDLVLSKCYERFHKKLSQLTDELNKK